MLNRFSLSFWIMVTGLTLLFSAGAATAEPPVVAKIVDTPVTVYELNREMQRTLPLNVNFHGKVSAEKIAEVRELSLHNLIDQGYKVQYALQQKISVSKADLDKRLEKVRGKFKTQESLQKALGEEKLDDFYASVKRMLLAKKAEELAVASKVGMTEAEIRDFYENNKQRYNRPKLYRASHILIKVDPTRIETDKEPARLKAAGLADRARKGEDFYNLAYYNSDDRTKMVGGDIGYFHAGQIVKEFEEAIANLSPGDIAGPVETLHGFYVIKLTDVKKSAQLPFAEVKEKIREQQEKKRYDLIYADWMAALKETYSHEIFP
ncbi:peptidylprolyl isomerase [uncultured Desulfuromusa sp.]|uniref:peptidylprolyl isomerase n=1 Tax=uncultured Desulfuromusa sp. TaxID=219183 RepID=UPI002AA61FD3|nr:peptidylprolyl isomerase [uncultured Desulfuromusa sp.]